MPRTVDEEAVEFLLRYVARTGDNPAHQQAKGFLERIEELDRQDERAKRKAAAERKP